MDEGPPSSYLLLAKDTPVFGSDGGVAGRVREVLCDPGNDIFDGLVLATQLGDRYIRADEVSAIHERGVDVAFPAAEAPQLPLPQPHRRIKYDLAADERPWTEVMSWLHDHLARLVHHGDPRLDGARASGSLSARRRTRSLVRTRSWRSRPTWDGRTFRAPTTGGLSMSTTHRSRSSRPSLALIASWLAGRWPHASKSMALAR
jgi:hypothetical protein